MRSKPAICSLVAASLAACVLSTAIAATPLPEWYGELATTRQGYEFTNDSLSPLPEILENPFGIPAASVTLGEFSDGWQDPLSEFDLTGVLEDGAWDLGKAGAITMLLKVAEDPPEPGTFYRIQFQVYVVAYLGITALPSLDTLGLAAEDLVFSQSLVASDPQFPGASWQGLKWTGYYDNVTSNQVSFAVNAPGTNTSVVDTVEVFTQVMIIPEPSAFLMMVISFGAWTLRRSRP